MLGVSGGDGGGLHRPVASRVGESKRAIEVLDFLVGLIVASPVDAELSQKTGRHRAVLRRSFHVHRAAVHEEHAPLISELVPLGVPSEVVVVVQDEDSGIGTHLLAKEISGRKPTDASSHHDEVVGFVRVPP